MLIDHARLRESTQGLTEKLAKDGSQAVRIPVVNSRTISGLHNQVSFDQHDQVFTIDSDELGVLGGGGTAPSPMRYFLSGIAFAASVWTAKCASLAEIELKSLEIDVETKLDVRGEHRVDESIPPHPQWLRITTRVESDATPDQVLAAIDDASRRSPLTTLVALAVPVHHAVYLNGDAIREAAVAEAG